MKENELIIKNLISKDENMANKACLFILNNLNDNLAFCFCQKFEYLFDFVKNNVYKRFRSNLNQNNYLNILKFFKYYSFGLDDFFIELLKPFINDNLKETFFYLFKNGNDCEKIYASKFFLLNPDIKVLNLAQNNALSTNDALMLNCVDILKYFKDNVVKNRALKLLKANDDFDKLLAVKFLCNFSDESYINDIFDTLKNSNIKENVADQIPYLINLFDYIKNKNNDAVFCFNCLIDGLGEIIPLIEVINFDFYNILKLLAYEYGPDSNCACVLLNAKSKFNILSGNEQYTYDESKETIDEIHKINNLLSNLDQNFIEAQKEILIDGLYEQNPFIYSILSNISEYKIDFAQLSVIDLLSTKNETLKCSCINCIKNLGLINQINQIEVIKSVDNENIKSIIKSYFE